MHLTTKTLVSLHESLSVAYQRRSAVNEKSILVRDRLFKILQKHDRKAELRSVVLNVSPYQFKQMLRERTLDARLKQHGFRSSNEYLAALMAKIKDELKHRGSKHEIVRSSRSMVQLG